LFAAPEEKLLVENPQARGIPRTSCSSRKSDVAFDFSFPLRPELAPLSGALPFANGILGSVAEADLLLKLRWHLIRGSPFDLS